MVTLAHKFSKLYTKLEENHRHRHYHHESDKISDSFETFQSQVSKFIDQLALDLKPSLEIEILSFSWIEKCFGLLSFTNKALTNLAMEIDYPMSIWELDSIEGYLNFTLCLLDLFNSISSSFSHLDHAKLSLSHGLSLLENNSHSPSSMNHLKAIHQGCYGKKLGEIFFKESDKGRIFSDKERVINEAMKEMKRIGFWVCGILLSGLYNDVRPYLELKELVGGFDGSLVLILDSKISEGLKGKVPVLKEVKEVNDAVSEVLVASEELKYDAVKELKRKLDVFVKVFDVVKGEVDDLFSKVMKQRTEMIDFFRMRKLY